MPMSQKKLAGPGVMMPGNATFRSGPTPVPRASEFSLLGFRYALGGYGRRDDPETKQKDRYKK